MAKVWMVEFRDGGQLYEAHGRDRDSMPVFAVLYGGRFRTKMRFPSCLSFMTYADVGDMKRVDSKAIERRFGPVASKPKDLHDYRTT